MSVLTTIQRRVHSSATIRRHVSSKAVRSHRSLPDVKMRALIALYHQADSFITPENLSQRIDDAFVPQLMDVKVDRRDISVKDLQNALVDQRKAPKITEWDEETLVKRDSSFSISWSSLKTARELKVVEALYGVNATQIGDVLPGLEVLEESGRIQPIPRDIDQKEMQEILQDEISDS